MAKESIRTKAPARRTRSSQKPVLALVASREDIERRAFEIYMARGASEGNALGDWIQAERELLSLQ